MNQTELWKATLGELETLLSKATFKSFFGMTKPGNLTETKLEVVCPSSYIADQINRKFLSLVKNSVQKIAGRPLEVELTVEKAEVKTDVGGLPLFTDTKNRELTQETNLLAKYTFDKFIVGPNNRLAHAIAVAVSENPGKVYNPFFLHAGVGLGKTHLMHAIGNQIYKNDPKARVVYATAESFMNELIEAIQAGRNKNYQANKFRDKFRKADVLLVDDIQFIAGRGEATQEEFFHTFNALYMAQKQIVLSSDRPPKELSALDARITSRFASGIVADMQLPDVETRSAILREKRNELKADVTNEVVDYIASSIETNIRELEGTFLQIITVSKAEGQEVSKEFCAKMLGKNVTSKANLNVNEILKAICTYYNIKITDLKGPSRVKEFAVPRQISMYMVRKFTNTPYMVIGDILGGRDHTTIMHGFEKIETEVSKDQKLKQDINNLQKIMNVVNV